MKKYLFQTKTTMKEYNDKKWWIASDVVTDKYIKAENINKALEVYRKLVKEDSYIEISDNAMKNKNNMYVDTVDGTKQVGYVITASTEFEDEVNYKWTKQYIDLWVNIMTIADTEFE